MDYAHMADQLITRATSGRDTQEENVTSALAGIGYALLHLAETVARLEP